MTRPVNSLAAGRLAAVLIGVGVALRVYHFAVRRSLWIDEARLALNVGGRSWSDLAAPLVYDQTAPLLFLWPAKLLFTVRPDEWGLRLIPLVAGTFSLIAICWLGRRLLSNRAAVLLLAVAAFSPVLIYFSNEFKPYIVDFAVTCALLCIAFQSLANQHRSTLATLAGVGAVAPWLSTPSVFVLAGVGAALASDPGLRRNRRQELVWTALAWVGSAAACYFFVLRPASANEYLERFWEYRFLAPGPDLGDRTWAAVTEVVAGTIAGLPPRAGIAEPERLLLTLAAAVLVPIGLVQLHRTHSRAIALLLALPLAAASVSALLGVYPVAMRVSLFAAPLWLLPFAGGVDQLVQRVRPAWLAVTAVTAALIIPAVYRDVHAAARPLDWEHPRPVIQTLRRMRPPTEAIYVSAGALPAWAFYTTNWKNPDQQRLRAYAAAGSSGGPSFENAASRRVEPSSSGQVRQVASPDGLELLGAYTGRQWLWGQGLSQLAPDPGWAATEAVRLCAAARPVVWLLTGNDRGADTILAAEVARLGGALDLISRASDASALRVAFRSPHDPGSCGVGMKVASEAEPAPVSAAARSQD